MTRNKNDCLERFIICANQSLKTKYSKNFNILICLGFYKPTTMGSQQNNWKEFVNGGAYAVVNKTTVPTS